MKRTAANSSRLAAAAAVILLIVSCGGPYTARRVAIPDEKLRIADDLFSRGKYAAAAVEYKDFLAVFAGDERGDYAQFRVAECYRMAGEYALAGVEYRILINDYGYSEYIDDAFFLEGLCSLRMAPRAERDQTDTYDALAKIRRFLQLFPDSPRRPEAERALAEIHDLLGKKAFESARLYFRRGHFQAAEIYLDKIIREFPETSWAARSWYYKGRIEERRGARTAAAEAYARVVQSPHEVSERSGARERLRELAKEDPGG